MVLGTVDINNLHIPFTYQHILASSHNINSLIAQSAHHTSQDGDYRISLCYTMNRQEVNNSFAVPTQPTNSSQHDIRTHHICETIKENMSIGIPPKWKQLWDTWNIRADWAVGFAIGLIANSDWSSGLNTMEAKNRYSFWASFLLVHLGGPDTICIGR
ncbi:calcium uniporter protein [Tanacetum coccineum]